MTSKFPTVTAEHLEQIAVYQQKWRLLATCTDRVVQNDCEAAIHAVYQRLGLDCPVIQIVDSPVAAINRLHSIITESNYARHNSLNRLFETAFKKELAKQTSGYSDLSCYPDRLNIKSIDNLKKQLDHHYHCHIVASIWGLSGQDSAMRSTFATQDWHYTQAYIAPAYLAPASSYLDWLCNCLNCDHDAELWSLFESLLTHCGWIFPFDKFCLVVDRPTHLQFDENLQLHAEAEPAVTFADGMNIYVYRGVKVNERYGEVSPKDWKPDWYLDEKDNRVRSILLKELDSNSVDGNWILSEPDSSLRQALVQKLDRQVKIISNEQIQLIEFYRLKWRNIALNTAPINSEKGENAIHKLYEFHKSIREPIVLIASSPFMGRKLIKQQYSGQKPSREHQRRLSIGNYYGPGSSGNEIVDRFWQSLAVQLDEPVRQQLHKELIINRSWNLEPRQDWWRSVVWAQPEQLSACLSLFEFCISVLGCIYNAELWETIQAVFTECGWFYPTDRFCVVCDRPRQIFVDSDDKLHREDGPAIIYADDYRQHARHGLRPKQYFREYRENVNFLQK
jgi:hypothetical protein